MLIYDAEDSSDPGPDPDTAMVLHIPIDQVRCLIQASAEKHTFSPLLCTVILFNLQSCSIGCTCQSPLEMFVHEHILFCRCPMAHRTSCFAKCTSKIRSKVAPSLTPSKRHVLLSSQHFANAV